MKIASNSYPMGSSIVPFSANKKTTKEDKNPISKTGERATLLKATVAAGLVLGGKCLLELCDGDFIWDWLFDAGENINKKNNGNSLKSLGIGGLLIGGFIAAVAAIYTLAKTPEVMYKGKVNAFVKGKDMDVYAKSNAVEKELYNQMNDKAKAATLDEKNVLTQQYLKLKAAKNQIPDSVKENMNYV